MHRIYFDTNEGPVGNDRYGLWLDASLKDMEPIADQLHDGLRVVIYMTGELEMQATLEFDKALNAWTARPIAGTIVIYAETHSRGEKADDDAPA
ncbi:hypothetical protein [Methylosinus sp. LW4]|uniref:hypothetical protein n=1 Tax=Methylosinus sp. LW4 TaxID=136993 RepID=UPI000369A85E|nr:hypothetical protein [Methylosinus sp. LW4]